MAIPPSDARPNARPNVRCAGLIRIPDLIRMPDLIRIPDLIRMPDLMSDVQADSLRLALACWTDTK